MLRGNCFRGIEALYSFYCAPYVPEAVEIAANLWPKDRDFLWMIMYRRAALQTL